MANTSLYIPADLLGQLDRIASEKGTSRNRVIIEACRSLIENDRGEWPEGFIESSGLNKSDLRTLRAGARQMREAIESGRASRREPPF